MFNGGGDEPVSRVGHRGHPRIGGDNDVVPVTKTLNELGGSGRFIALEIGHHAGRGLDVKAAQQIAQSSGVLGSDDAGVTQGLDEGR